MTGEPAVDGGQTIRIGDLARLDVRPGDAVVYQPTVPLSLVELDGLSQHWAQLLPDVQLVVLCQGELTVLRPAPYVPVVDPPLFG